MIALYQSGMTQLEVAIELGTTQKIVWGTLKRNGVQCRKAAKRFQSGAANAYWKGDAAGYQAFHRRLEARFGKPRKCDVCGYSDPTKRYEWANLTGHYEDDSDFKRMCVPCHRRHDKAVLNFKGAVGGRPSKAVMPSA